MCIRDRCYTSRFPAPETIASQPSLVSGACYTHAGFGRPIGQPVELSFAAISSRTTFFLFLLRWSQTDKLYNNSFFSYMPINCSTFSSDHSMLLFTVTDQSQRQLDAGTGEKIEQCSILCWFPALAFLVIFPAPGATLHVLVYQHWSTGAGFQRWKPARVT